MVIKKMSEMIEGKDVKSSNHVSENECVITTNNNEEKPDMENNVSVSKNVF